MALSEGNGRADACERLGHVLSWLHRCFEGVEVALEPPLQPGLFARVENRLTGWRRLGLAGTGRRHLAAARADPQALAGQEAVRQAIARELLQLAVGQAIRFCGAHILR